MQTAVLIPLTEKNIDINVKLAGCVCFCFSSFIVFVENKNGCMEASRFIFNSIMANWRHLISAQALCRQCARWTDRTDAI